VPRLPAYTPALLLRVQEFLGLGDRVHDVSPYVASPCGQALLQCPGRTAPDFLELRWGGVGGWVGGWLVYGTSVECSMGATMPEVAGRVEASDAGKCM